MRDDFSADMKRTLAARVGNHCSRPECRALTSGPQVTKSKSLNVGVAAHITAAASGGPRYNPKLTEAEREDIDNGIWLCQNCAKLIDNDPTRFTEAILRQWKKQSEDHALSQIGRTKLTEQAATQSPQQDMEEITRSLKKLEERVALLLTKEDVNALAAQAASTKRKHWRGLELCAFPILEGCQGTIYGFFENLFVAIHKTFQDSKYIKFSVFVEATMEEVAGHSVKHYEITSHHPYLCANVTNSFKSVAEGFAALKSRNATTAERTAYENRVWEEYKALFAGWGHLVNFEPDFWGRILIEIEYDSLSRRISVEKIKDLSIRPENFPEHVKTTSELFRFLAALSAPGHVLLIDDGDWYFKDNYPLVKFMAYYLDKEGYHMNRIQFNVDDPEEWDYVYTDFEVQGMKSKE